jgi:pilT protein domain protein
MRNEQAVSALNSNDSAHLSVTSTCWLIAAQTLSHHLTLITHNVREFSRIAELQWEDWLHD